MMIIRVYAVFVILLTAALNTNAADTLTIRRTVKQLLNSSGQPYNYRVIKQEFYGPDGVLFREINYSDTDGELTSYLFCFYRNGKLFTEEFHNASDSLEYLIHHLYDSRGNEKTVTRLLPSLKGKMSVDEKQMKSYKNGYPVQIKWYKGKKLSYVTRYLYDDSARLIQENITWKNPGSKYIRESREYSYNREKIARISVESADRKGVIYRTGKVYDYNKDGRLASIKLMSEDGASISEETYKYNKNGDLMQFEEYDAQGKRILMLQYEYLKNFMEKGVQTSYYENL